MGCAASSQPVEGNDNAPLVGNTPADPRSTEDRQQSTTDASKGNHAQTNGGGNGEAKDSAGVAAAQPPNAVPTFNVHNIVDSRGARVSTVIQNRSKVDTLCKWADNVLRARVANGGVFANPQDGRVRKGPIAQQPSDVTSSAADTASVSSRHAAPGATTRTEYGSMVSNGGLLGVSTTAHATSSQSRGNLTMIAHKGSDEEDTQVSVTRVDAEEAPSPQ